MEGVGGNYYSVTKVIRRAMQVDIYLYKGLQRTRQVGPTTKNYIQVYTFKIRILMLYTTTYN